MGREHYLKDVEKAFKVRLTARDAVLKIQGKKGDVADARELFEQLKIAHERGVRIRQHEFRYALDAVKSHRAGQLEELWSSERQIHLKRVVIAPKTFLQREYLDAIAQNDLVFGVGPAGTGKTYLAVAMAAMALKKEEVSRIVLTRPAVEAGEALGFLPGDLKEKIYPYLRPVYDALYEMLGHEDVERFTAKGVIEISPLAYMRGRTLSNAFIILDEAQNTTTEQMFMLLTRMGSDSKCVVTGDPTQIDLPGHRKSGLIEAIQALEGIQGIAMIAFDERDVLRHELVSQIVHAYKEHRGARQTSLNL